MDVFDKLQALAVFFNDAANGAFLLAVALVVLILAAVGVVWMRDKVRSLSEMADPAYNPGLDRREAALRRALAADVHDVFPEVGDHD